MARQTSIEKLGVQAFEDAFVDGSLTEFIDDEIKYIGAYGIVYRQSLTKIDLGNVEDIAGVGIAYNYNLITTIIRSETMPTMGSIFQSCPIQSGTGYLYVPKALVDSYKTQTYLKNYANQIRALEDYTVDGTITGELDESKI